MKPTNRLRFVQREKTMYNALNERYQITPYKVLQQWWAIERHGQITPDGEWRDVPLEEE